MGVKTKIDWCDSSWNPITGCKHGCEYCYARRISERFGGVYIKGKDDTFPVLEEPYRRQDNGAVNPYPYGFTPTFHRYRLDEPTKWKKPKSIFICSMADLFGEWVPLEYILEIFEACRKAPQHRYIFLTKNPVRYESLENLDKLPNEDNFWFGSTTDRFTAKIPYFYHKDANTFISIEPILERFNIVEEDLEGIKWVIVGAETGNRKGKVIPEKEWIMHIAECCDKTGTALFMKESLRDIMGSDFRQTFPWEVE